MKPVRLPASATRTLPRWGLLALCLLYILPGLLGRDLWKNEDAAGFGVMWTMAHGGLSDWLWPHIVGLPQPDEGPLAFWIGALFIKLFGGLLGDMLAARLAPALFFLLGSMAIWHTTYQLGRRSVAQPLKLAFGGQPEPNDYGRTLADGALLIYLGCLGLLLHSHATSANALQVSMVACTLYAAVRFFDQPVGRRAALLGLGLGLAVLTRGFVLPTALLLALLLLATTRDRKATQRLLLTTLPVALIVAGGWALACTVIQPFNGSPIAAWAAKNLARLGPPSLSAIHFLLKDSVWFAWPAWPFAAWAVYAWRKQEWPLHIALPFSFFLAATLLVVLNADVEQALLLPLLPPLAVLAAFGLPTMKRSAINAVDWFSVMMLTFTAAFIWLGWIAKQTGWPVWLARNAIRQIPGFKPEFSAIAFGVALVATVGWIVVVHWRISRRPSVLWRAVVLSSGGVILIWLLLMTLWLPSINYSKSYADVAHQIADKLPPVKQCVDSNVGPAQRASFAYFGRIPFAEFDGARCDFLLLQDSHPKGIGAPTVMQNGSHWSLIWEGRRPSDKNERFRLYRRMQ